MQLAEVVDVVLGKLGRNVAGPLGFYYKCFLGANAHLGLTEDNSFAMEDDKGRSWICHPIKREDVEALNLFKKFPAIKEPMKNSGQKRTNLISPMSISPCPNSERNRLSIRGG